MLLNELLRVIEQVGKDKGISKDMMVDVVKSAMVTAAKKKFGSQNEIEAVINDVDMLPITKLKEIADIIGDGRIHPYLIDFIEAFAPNGDKSLVVHSVRQEIYRH